MRLTRINKTRWLGMSGKVSPYPDIANPVISLESRSKGRSVFEQKRLIDAEAGLPNTCSEGDGADSCAERWSGLRQVALCCYARHQIAVPKYRSTGCDERPVPSRRRLCRPWLDDNALVAEKSRGTGQNGAYIFTPCDNPWRPKILFPLASNRIYGEAKV